MGEIQDRGGGTRGDIRMAFELHKGNAGRAARRGSAASARALRERIPPGYRCRASRSDLWLAYEEVFPRRTHRLVQRGPRRDLPCRTLQQHLAPAARTLRT